MADDQEDFKARYAALVNERVVLSDLLDKEMAQWDRQGPRPASLLDAEAKLDDLDVKLDRLQVRAIVKTSS
jgi:hypothetical protein